MTQLGRPPHAGDLHEAVAAVAPVSWVRMGTTDKSTWQVFFEPEATEEQKAAAQAVIDGLEFN